MKVGLSTSVLALLLGPGAVAAHKERIFPSLRRTALAQAASAAPVEELDSPEEAAAAPAAPSEPQALTAVPLLRGEGQDSFPKLPEVASMLGMASQTMQSLAAQAAALQQQVAASQKTEAERMARQKAVFEQKLKAQELENRALTKANTGVKQDIAKLKGGNAAVRKHAIALRTSNELARTELHALVGRMQTTVGFADSALDSTDDSGAKELLILAPKQAEHAAKPDAKAVAAASAPRHGLAAISAAAKSVTQNATSTAAEDEEEDEDEDQDEEAEASFLAVSRRTQGPAEGAADVQRLDANASGLAQMLQKGVQSFAEEERSSEAKLKSLFVAGFKAGAQRHAALVAKQRQLNATRGALTEEQRKLRVADTHLQGTAASLDTRLRSMGRYLQKLAHLALAPRGEVSRLLQALPATVVSEGKAAPAVGASAAAASVPQEA